MSQHILDAEYKGEILRILIGWDKPLQGFFMVIDYVEKNSDEPFWSNLLHYTPSHPKTLEPFLGILKELHITLPDPMIAELEDDGRTNAGNKVVLHYVKDGIYGRKTHEPKGDF